MWSNVKYTGQTTTKHDKPWALIYGNEYIKIFIYKD